MVAKGLGQYHKSSFQSQEEKSLLAVNTKEQGKEGGKVR